MTQLRAAAAGYGVPATSLRDALHDGLLAELGMERAARDELGSWLEVGEPGCGPGQVRSKDRSSAG